MGRSMLPLMATGAGLALGSQTMLAEAPKEVDYHAIRNEIAGMLDVDDFDDGSLGPIFVRLAWHASGTYDKNSCTGGSAGATMRFCPESNWDANAGLGVARDLLEKVKRRHAGISHGDLWTLAAVVAIEEMGGPKIAWRPGRVDAVAGAFKALPDGRLPDGDKGGDHLRHIFYKMGMNDQEIVALTGAHCLGRMHKQNSGWDGPWTRSPTTFSNEFFRELVENKWTPGVENGLPVFRDPTGDLLMLPADLAMLEDPAFKKWTMIYAYDEKRFFNDFAAAFNKLTEAGCKFPADDSFLPFIAIATVMGLALAKGG